MGERAGILAFGDDIPARLRSRPVADIDRTTELVEMIHPGFVVEPIGGNTLLYATYPPDDVVFASSSADLDIVCDRRLTFDNPSTLPEHLQRIGSGRRIATLGMHSVVDWLSYAAWSDGALVRSLTVSPDGGIIETSASRCRRGAVLGRRAPRRVHRRGPVPAAFPPARPRTGGTASPLRLRQRRPEPP